MKGHRGSQPFRQSPVFNKESFHEAGPAIYIRTLCQLPIAKRSIQVSPSDFGPRFLGWPQSPMSIRLVI